MGCLIFILALAVPRLVMFFIWLLTDWFSVAYQTWIIPLLGFLFLPYTTLAYMGAMLNAGEVTTGWLLLIILAVLADISHMGAGSRVHRGR